MNPTDHRIKQIQEKLVEADVDGWLLYDNHGSNRFVRHILGIPSQQMLTRRFFYWIPKEGAPHKILHRIEAGSLDRLPGSEHLYLAWIEVEPILRQFLNKGNTLFMEYSPRGANPYVSAIDAGTMEFIRALDVEIVSSADLMQHFTSVLTEQQIQTHQEAARVVQETVNLAWEMIASHLKNQQPITELDVQNLILKEFAARHCHTEEGPICAVNEHSAMPHYMATQSSAKVIKPGDLILIDLWCKRMLPEAVYADITRVAVAGAKPQSHQLEIFDIVFKAQQKGIDLIVQAMSAGHELRGAEVDDACRGFIKSQGYGSFFTHRTGHNIDTSVHGADAHLDNFETSDYRQLLPGMCFTIEPGIYLPGNCGIRLETDVLIKHDRTVEITGGIEDSLICLF